MKKSCKACGGAIASLALVLAAGSSQAALVNFGMTGNVEFADAGNAFGLLIGDTISASGVFDDVVLSGGSGSISFDSGSGNSLNLSVGSVSFTESSDSNYGFGGASLVLSSGVPTDLNYASTLGEFGFFDSLFDFFDGEDNAGMLVSGTWDVNSFSTSTAVPIPAAIWLFGSGLIGLVRISCKGKMR